VRRSALAAVAAVAVALASCGDDDKSSDTPASTSSGTLTKTELIRKGDELCGAFRSKTPKGNPQGFGDLKSQVDVVISLSEDTLRKFEKLRPPPGDSAVIDKYLQSQRDQIALLRQVSKAAEAEDKAAVQRYVADIRETGQKAKGLAQGYGFKVCGSESGATA
jgi:hypothetical protein